MSLFGHFPTEIAFGIWLLSHCQKKAGSDSWLASCVAFAPTTAYLVMASHRDHIDDVISETKIREVNNGEQHVRYIFINYCVWHDH